MPNVKVTRPIFPKGYADSPSSSLTWDYVTQRLTEAKNYWFCSVRPDGRPHAIPRWGIFLEGKIYYDGSPETRHAQNILQNPKVSVHLESGDEALIAEGICSQSKKPDLPTAKRLSDAFCKKYEKFGYTPGIEQWDEGGLYIFTPSKVLAWTAFFENPTKFILE